MKKMMLLFSMVVLFQLTTMAQAYLPYISEERGDTLVVLDEIGYGDANSLTLCMASDTIDVPAGRVYLLENYGFYPLTSNPTSDATQKIIIMGESNESIKLRKDAAFPPIVCGFVWEGGNSIGNLRSGNDLLVKNIACNAGNSAGNLGWTMFGNNAGTKITVENCIVEHNQWCLINPSAGSTVIFKNNFLVNFVGHSCRRNGGIIDFFASQDTIIAENNTIVNAQGSLFKFRDSYNVNRAIFNHNTFINCAGYAFMNWGNTGNISITNNIFVNSNDQAYCSVFQSADAGEVDPRDEPMGIVNVYADSAGIANGMTFYADANLIYWDARFDNYVSTLSSGSVNGTAEWHSQMITMNEPSQILFDDDETYPLLAEGTWIEGIVPNFAEPMDLLSTQVDNLKSYVLACVDTSSTQVLPDWRTNSTPVSDNFVYNDWPIDVDLSYDNADLLVAGIGGFPLGDLDWFPAQKATWEAQAAAEHAAIHEVLYVTGIPLGVEVIGGAVADKYELSQNYPNPFNPTTNIKYSIPEASNVTLKVYDILGKEVATLVNEFQNANSYKVDFNASSLSTGVYIYKLEAGNFSITKKMLLLK